jgi:acetylglutamate kinase
MSPLHIVKIGGKLIDVPLEGDAANSTLERVLRAFVALPGNKILVHGGGDRASRLSRRLGIEPRMHQGRRLTGAADLEVAVMVYAGLANKAIVAQLQALGCDALGLCGADGDILRAHKRVGGHIDYGFAGDIDAVGTRSLLKLLDAGFTPVCCAITHDGRGQLLNTNADTIAASLAAALATAHPLHLHFCFEKPGVLSDPHNDRSVIPILNAENYRHYREQGFISDGMIPKLDNAFQALLAGAREVVICGPESLGGPGGTRLTT